MKLTPRDILATALVAAIVVPYGGYLWQGNMPFIEDRRGMSAVALVLGAAAFFTAGRISAGSTVGKVELGLALVTLTVGLVALAMAESAAAEALLAAFFAAIVTTWGVQMLHHMGYLSIGDAPTDLRHR